MTARNPPNVFAMTPPGSQSGRRQSRFTEHTMQEFTPANSVYEDDTEYGPDDELSPPRVLLRLGNGICHGVACILLVAILVQFLHATGGTYYRLITPEAITLLVLLSCDILLDLFSLIRFRWRCPGWLLMLRLVFGIGYLAVFMAYIGLGRVFTPGFTYWGMHSSYAGPVVYLFLWGIGVWNLLHTALRRHSLGNGMRSYIASARSLGRRGGRPNHRGAQELPDRAPPNAAAGRDVESLHPSRTSTRTDAISLEAQQRREEDEEDKTASVTSTISRAAKADEAGETGLRPPPPRPRGPP